MTDETKREWPDVVSDVLEIQRQDCIAFRGPSGWWYYAEEYPEEGSAGPFDSFRDMVEHLDEADSRIVDILDNPGGKEPTDE